MSEAENILQTIKATVQDIVAPDVRELKVRMSSLEDQSKVQYEALRSQSDALKTQFGALRGQFESLVSQSDAQFRALMAAISQSKAETELSTYKQIAALSERVAALEARRQ